MTERFDSDTPSTSPDPHGHVGEQVEVPHLEIDETVPPRPEEEIADAARGTLRPGADAYGTDT